MEVTQEEYLAHYGVLRKSGRYPWGSGGTQTARNRLFLDTVENLRKQGLTETQIVESTGLDSTTQLRALKSIAKNEQRQSNIAQAQRLKNKGYSNTAIGERMGINESSVRAMLAPGQKERADQLKVTAEMLRQQVETKKFVDVGKGVESHMGVSVEKLNTAISILKEEGYKIHYVNIPQLGTTHETKLKVLTAPKVEYSTVLANKGLIQPASAYSEDGGSSFLGREPHEPIQISSKRLAVRYAEDGGAAEDGVIHVREGVKDLSLGSARYAQVRIAVDGTHYLKGMAIYKDDLPKGVDLVFNTNKSNSGNKLDALKAVSGEKDNPFGATTRPIVERDAHGKVKLDANGKEKVTSAMNIVNTEGDWSTWSKSLSTQLLSKQSPSLARTQLNMTYEQRKKEFAELSSLTNPTVRKSLLEKFGDETDSAAVHLDAAALPRQAYHVILPLNTISPTQIYAPNFRDGERVVLVRFPHGGTFEIPELTVNNSHAEGKHVLGGARDAVGIHHSVAERLSGADFDGDQVVVIPNNHGKIKTSPALEGLKDFDPKREYPAYEGMPRMTPKQKGMEMGQVSNLITDMTIHNASQSEIARAVRHSMVVIDAEKHHLNYKESARANGISQLKAKYQGGATRGASTLISRATSEQRVPERKNRTAAKGGPIDKATGERVFEPTGRNRTTSSTKLAETTDAHTLTSGLHGTPMERLYADHSNRLKALANEARLASVHTPRATYSPSAKKAYATEVHSLNSKLTIALRNRPLERHAQVVGNAMVAAKREANPNMDDATLKKVKAQELNTARIRTGAKKEQIHITDEEWHAIQAGAISDSKLQQILTNADIDRVRELATPKRKRLMTTTNTTRAKAMLGSGYTRAEVADLLGVSLTTLDEATK